jgi:hypothetical protein
MQVPLSAEAIRAVASFTKELEHVDLFHFESSGSQAVYVIQTVEPHMVSLPVQTLAFGRVGHARILLGTRV